MMNIGGASAIEVHFIALGMHDVGEAVQTSLPFLSLPLRIKRQ
jgi:hypothetical protein